MHAPTSPAPLAALPRRRVPTLLKASGAVHLGAVAAVIAAPAAWPWALGAVALNHALVTATGLWPRSTWLGPNLLRLPHAAAARREVALTIDDGPDPEVTPQVLDLLDAAHARATFFCIASEVERHAALTREIVQRGHSVQNHSHRHVHTFSLLGPRGMRAEIERAQDVLAQVTGQRPRYFRAPAGLRNPFLDPVLSDLGLQLVSWTRRGFDTRARDPIQVLGRLTHGLAAGDILLVHDGHAARDRDGRPIVLDVLPALLHRFDAAQLRAVTLPDALAVPAPAGAAAAATPA